MLCPHCHKQIPDNMVNKHFASIGAKKLSDSMTPQQRLDRSRKANKAKQLKIKKNN